ncbi:MAG: META domain-containing protein [Gammaproteobacteria bacterium]|nr:META domain-containing protein [Gammaproteobacteria bacterium]NIN61933.1 META domain-containing protein [Gammaproteobacteria bacterium]NIO62012.1 META domain-containing protein [Gammaproteobacteria bacterium]NIQ08379.1 META domain-containing protein [Gammaproteobacteria bacterium]NIQ19724.1 META domain-containing protein [Gammaproteobacteria bacterium]
MSNDNDKELNDYLQGNSELSQRYQPDKGSGPPAHLDKLILDAAKNEIKPPHMPRWTVPLSIAAVMVIGVGIVFNIYREQGQPLMTAPESTVATKARDVLKEQGEMENRQQIARPSAPAEPGRGTSAINRALPSLNMELADQAAPGRKRMIWEKQEKKTQTDDSQDKQDTDVAMLGATDTYNYDEKTVRSEKQPAMSADLALDPALAPVSVAEADQVTADIELPFKAMGNEPGWSLTISEDQIELVTSYGQEKLVTSTPEVITTEAGSRYLLSAEGQALEITIRDSRCRDSMSGMPYPRTVKVIMSDKTLSGCGGQSVSLLLGDEWIVEDIGNKGIIDFSRVTINFSEDGRIHGLAGCNQYSGSYQISGELLSVGLLISTRRACPEALMNQEAFFLELLQLATGFDFDEHGALIIKTKEGKTILIRR